jgi:hypothetical protein
MILGACRWLEELKSLRVNWPPMRIAGWVLLAVGLALVVYGKYFFHPPYAGCGIIVAMIGATLLLWRKEERDSSKEPPETNQPF